MHDILNKNINNLFLLQITTVALFLSIVMKFIMFNDHYLKIATMSFSIAILFCSINHFNHSQRLNYSFFIYFLIIYITSLALMKFYYEKIKNKSIKVQKQFINKITITYSIFYLTSTILIYCIYYQIWNIVIIEQNFFTCLLIVIFSLCSLILIDFYYLTNVQQVIKRKLFHIGPIITIPIIHELNSQLLILILFVGFYTFFILEYIRYYLKEINFADNNYQLLKKTHITDLFRWMNKFNQREKGFWFTHLFLILSLLFSYLMPVLFPYYQNYAHLILILVAADGFAAVIGKSYGKNKIYQSKTIQGTLSFILSFFIGYSIILYKQDESLLLQKILISIICGLGELYGGDADNILPILIFYVFKMIIK